MTREDIKNWSNSNGLGYRSDLHEMYERLYLSAYNDGIFAERDACAEIAEKQRYTMHISLTSNPVQNGTAVGIAKAIRARGDKHD